MSTRTARSPQPAAALPISPGHDGTIRPSPAFRAVLHHDFDAVASSWRAFQTSGGCTAYQQLDWTAGIVSKIMPRERIAPLIVEIIDQTSGLTAMLMPFAIKRRLGHTEVTWLDCGVCDYAAPLLAPGFAPTAGEAEEAWTAALAVLPAADLLHIEQICERIGARPNPLAMLPRTRPMAMESFGLAIDGSPDTLLKRLCSKSTNHSLKRCARKLAAAGEVRFVVATTEAEADGLFTALMDQRRQRFRDLGRVDLLDGPEVRDFYRDAVRQGLREGPARLFGLAVGDQWIATALGLVHNGAFHGILLAMDSKWRSHSPGLRIATEIMVWARSIGLTYFDLTVGDLPYKASLGALPNTLHEIAFATSLRGRLVLGCGQLTSAAKTWLKARPGLFEPLRAVRQGVRRLGNTMKPVR